MKKNTNTLKRLIVDVLTALLIGGTLLFIIVAIIEINKPLL
jgi:hypothetical protein